MARAASLIACCVCLFNGLGALSIRAQETADSTTKSDTPAEEELKLLAGTWVLVDWYMGDAQRHIAPLAFSLNESGETVWYGDERGSFWTTTIGKRIEVDPEAFPKEMDIIVEGIASRMVYELRDDTLTLASGKRGTIPKKVGIDLFGNYWRYVRGLDKGRELLVRRLLEQLANEYRVSVWPPAARADGHWPHKERLKIDGDTFAFDKKGVATAYKFTLNPLLEENLGAGKIVHAKPGGAGRSEDAKKPFIPFQIDVKIDAVTYKGIYEIDSGRLRFSYFVDKPSERPETLDAEGAVWVTLTPTTEKPTVRAPGLRGRGARRSIKPAE